MGRGKRLDETGSEVNALRMSVGKNVKAARELADLSQRDLCAKTGISQSYLSQVENGTWNIGLDNIERIARAVGIAPYLLLHPSFARGPGKPSDSLPIKIADAPTKAEASPVASKRPKRSQPASLTRQSHQSPARGQKPSKPQV
jgi:transcriptional regulator with XRE-family HTH domain